MLLDYLIAGLILIGIISFVVGSFYLLFTDNYPRAMNFLLVSSLSLIIAIWILTGQIF